MGSIPVINVKLTGKNISVLRKKKGLSIHELQDRLGLSVPQTIYQWEKGEILPSVDNLVILASVLEVTVDQILITENIG